jgi:hypothetical protein
MRRLLIIACLLLAACSSAPTPTAAPTQPIVENPADLPTAEPQEVIEGADTKTGDSGRPNPPQFSTEEAVPPEQAVMEAFALYVQANLIACELPRGTIAAYLVVEDARAEVEAPTDCPADSVFATADPNSITSRETFVEAVGEAWERVTTPELEEELGQVLSQAVTAADTMTLEDNGSTARLPVGNQPMVFRLVNGVWYLDPSP